MFKINNKDRKTAMAYFEYILDLFIVIILSGFEYVNVFWVGIKEEYKAQNDTLLKQRQNSFYFDYQKFESGTFTKITFVISFIYSPMRSVVEC